MPYTSVIAWLGKRQRPAEPCSGRCSGVVWDTTVQPAGATTSSANVDRPAPMKQHMYLGGEGGTGLPLMYTKGLPSSSNAQSPSRSVENATSASTTRRLS